jgi:acetyl-CoA carboxylase carboxyl transferase subunit alpha
LGLIDELIPEPLGGAHRDVAKLTQNLRKVLAKTLANLNTLSIDELLARRYDRLMSYGKP